MKNVFKFLVVVCLAFASSAALAQTTLTTGSIAGDVVDSNGAVVPGATVKVSGALGERTTTTTDQGRYSFDNLVPGSYTVRVEKENFKAAEVTEVTVLVNKTTTANVTLQAGQISEVVTVTGGGSAVDQASTAISSNLNDQLFTNLPVQRAVSGLFYLAPGASDGLGGGRDNPSISGGSALDNLYVADGVNITDSAFGGIGTFSRSYGALGTGINTSFVKEVQVKTAGFEPQYGQSQGGIVNIVTQSGGNEYHGDAYYFGRNGAPNAKNYFIGLGGKQTIGASHIAAAVYGIENNLGCLVTPLRACFNQAEDAMLDHLPDVYFQIVMQRDESNHLVTSGLYIGDDQETYLQAARRSREQNITVFEKPIEKIVAVMQADEFRATWVANKAVYRTRMAIADGGELLILAPGVERFGEQPEVDALIRKYGYRGTERTLRLYKTEADMQAIPHGVAHLIHGSSEGRFTITYAPGHLTREEIESVGYRNADLAEAQKRYDPARMKEGWNTMPDGEEVFYISTPSAGLWITHAKLNNPSRRDYAPAVKA